MPIILPLPLGYPLQNRVNDPDRVIIGGNEKHAYSMKTDQMLHHVTTQRYALFHIGPLLYNE